MVKPGAIIVRVDDVKQKKDTPKRRKTADIIVDLWPEEKKVIAEQADVSRSHVDNTLDTHFQPLLPYEYPSAIPESEIDEAIKAIEDHWGLSETKTLETDDVPSIEPPRDESTDFVTGYMEGFLECWRKMQADS